jgi:hypothetical protein
MITCVYKRTNYEERAFWDLISEQSKASETMNHPDDGGSTHLYNVGLLQQDYMTVHPRWL